LTPDECTFRINRDYRFSKNKEPYKTHLAGGFSHNGKAGHTAGYYFEIQPTGIAMSGGGQFWIEPDILYKIRREIHSNPVPLFDIIQSPDFIDTFGGLSQEHRLKTCPKGFDKHSHAIELLRYKNFIAFENFDISSQSDDQIQGEILKRITAVSSLVKYLRTVL
jgi:uncharacterized protein (TIGR02453 family)